MAIREWQTISSSAMDRIRSPIRQTLNAVHGTERPETAPSTVKRTAFPP
jgi:hypothetical protein